MKTSIRRIFLSIVFFSLVLYPLFAFSVFYTEHIYGADKVREAEDYDGTQNISVLLYHHLLPESDLIEYNWFGNNSVISVESFKAQMEYLHSSGYYTATLAELKSYMKGASELPEKTVVITFDDGYLSNAEFAYPILKEFGMRATVFMVGNTSIKPQRSYSPLGTQHISVPTFDQYRDVFDFGCHTYDLHKKNSGKPVLLTMDRDEIKKDLSMNRSIIGSDYFAYPFGAYNNRAVDLLKESGYAMAMTTKSGYVDKNTHLFKIPRFVIYPSTTIENFRDIITGGLSHLFEPVVY